MEEMADYGSDPGGVRFEGKWQLLQELGVELNECSVSDSFVSDDNRNTFMVNHSPPDVLTDGTHSYWWFAILSRIEQGGAKSFLVFIEDDGAVVRTFCTPEEYLDGRTEPEINSEEWRVQHELGTTIPTQEDLDRLWSIVVRWAEVRLGEDITGLHGADI